MPKTKDGGWIFDDREALRDRYADVEVLAEAGDWDESKHPRVPAGQGEESGRFTDGGGGVANEEGASILEGKLDPGRNADSLVEQAFKDRQKVVYYHQGDPEYRQPGNDGTRGPYTREEFDAKVSAKVEDLKDSPLVHMTHVEAVADILAHGIQSAHNMEDEFSQRDDDIDSLKSDLDVANRAVDAFRNGERGELEGIRDQYNWLKLDTPEAMDATVEHLEKEIETLESTKGNTFAADKTAGLDRFVFGYHGMAGHLSHTYGSVALIIDNEAFLKNPGAFATPVDIAKYANEADGGFSQATRVGRYAPETIEAYQKNIVSDGGYLKAMAAVEVSGAFPQFKWELKMPGRIDPKHILGVVVTRPEDYDTLIEAGVPDRKIHYVEEFNYTSERGDNKFLTGIKALQRGDEWPQQD